MHAVVGEALHGSGISLEAVDTLASALAQLAEHRIDLVLLDLGLPDSEGPDGVRRLLAEHPGLPLIVLTARDDDATAREALRRGAQDYVVKGSVARLERLLRNTVERCALQARLGRMLRRESALVQLGRLALEGSSLPELADRISGIVAEALEADAVSVATRGDGGVRVLGGHGWDGVPLPIDVPRDTVPVLDRTLEEGSSQQCPDLAAALGSDNVLAQLGFVSCAGSPIVLGDEGPTGLIAVFDRRERHYLASELEFLEAMARAVGEAGRRARAEAALVERVKEQTAVARVARLVQDQPGLPELLEGVAAALAPALRYPELTGVAIEIDGERTTAGPPDLAVELRVPIMVGGDRRGHVRVGYTEAHRFLDEERSLLHTVSESVAAWIARADADAALRESEERLRALVEQHPGYVWTTDRDLVVTSVEGAPFSEGVGAEDMLGASMAELSPTGTSSADPVAAHLEALAGGQAAYTFARAGRVWQVQVRPLRDQDGTIVGVIGGATDVTAQVEATRQAEHSRQRLQGLFDHALEAIVLYDDDERYVDANPAALRLLGRRREEIVGRPVGGAAELVAGPARPSLETLRREGHRSAEQTIRRADGSELVLELQLVPDIADGLHLATARDVTAERRAEQALRESEARFRRLAENAPDMIYRVGLQPEPHFEYLSPAVEGILGYPPEHFYEDPARARKVLTHPERSILGVDPDADAPLAAVLEMIHRDGSLRYVERRAVVVRDRDGQAVAIEAIARDVTEARRVDEALRASRAQLSRVLETMSEGLLMFDATGVLTYVNPAGEATFEASRDELIGRRYDDPRWQLLDAEGRPLGPEQRVVHRVLTTREAVEGFVLGRRRSDGTLTSWETNASPLHDGDGSFSGLVLSLRDVTERLRADRAVRAALEREREAAEHLRDVDQMKTAFLQAVSHELRTPLTSVLGFSVLLRRHAELPDEQVDRLAARLERNAQKLDRLLTDLLDVDRLTRGTLEARRSTVELDDLFRRVIVSLDAQVERVALRPTGLSADIDGPRTERIVENLLLNALRHTGGEVELTAEATEDGVLLTVGDRGPGVPDDLKDVLFEPFQQGDTPAARVGGAGIGLTVVSTFAQLHGGRAWVEDRPGGGSLFRVLLPTPTGSPVHTA